jgi:hypothetical protein
MEKKIVRRITPMEIRYMDAGLSETAVLEKVRKQYFPELAEAKMKIIFDLKKKMSDGKIVLARIQKANDLIRHLTEDEVEDGVDYIVFLDKVCWDSIPEIDKERLMRHELRHSFFDAESENPFKLQPHDIEDFVAEVELNKDDIGWRRRVADLTIAIYEQKKDQDE